LSKLIKGVEDRIFVLRKIDVWSTAEGEELFTTVDFLYVPIASSIECDVKEEEPSKASSLLDDA